MHLVARRDDEELTERSRTGLLRSVCFVTHAVLPPRAGMHEGAVGEDRVGVHRLDEHEVRFLMLIAIVPLLVAIIGLLIYVLASNAKVVEVGRALMWCGILVTVLATMSRTVKLF